MNSVSDEAKFRVVRELRARLTNLPPEHDTPIGMVHPYWARKPMNILEAIISHLSSDDDLVVDPFMGSGTTVFAALAANRRSAGSDISRMAHHLVTGVLDLLTNGETLLPEIRRILTDHRRETLPWFAYDQDNMVERERFRVDGDFSNGAFELVLTEVVTKREKGSAWTSRTVWSEHESMRDFAERRSDEFKTHLGAVIDFESVDLLPNSRIAIPQGATLAHFFTEQNQASINILLELIEDSPLSADHSAALKLVLSASLPLLRLSDRKASSQWPYWRPKKDLTSRNPVMVLEDRFRQIQKMVRWAQKSIPTSRLSDAYQLFALSAQELNASHLRHDPKLVLTDPPYGDQVPYGEYAAMWNAVLGLDVPTSVSSQELVRSDALHRQTDSADYLNRLKSAFTSNAALLGPDSYLAWFYQDQDLRCWSAIFDAARSADVHLIDVIAIPKQRRSLKTVTSPNSTLDGDLLCVFSRLSDAPDTLPVGSDVDVALWKEAANPPTYFGRYATLVSTALRSGDIKRLAEKYGTVKRALAAGEG